jgi:hypothetical protein
MPMPIRAHLCAGVACHHMPSHRITWTASALRLTAPRALGMGGQDVMIDINGEGPLQEVLDRCAAGRARNERRPLRSSDASCSAKQRAWHSGVVASRRALVVGGRPPHRAVCACAARVSGGGSDARVFIPDVGASNMKRKDLAREYGISSVCFVPVEGGVMECTRARLAPCTHTHAASTRTCPCFVSCARTPPSCVLHNAHAAIVLRLAWRGGVWQSG